VREGSILLALRYLLPVARGLYALLGIGSILIGVGNLSGGLSPGARLDWISVALALVVGIGALWAAAWVQSRSPLRTLLASIGIVIVLLAVLLPAYGLFGTEYGSNVIVFYLIPMILDLVFTIIMVKARWSARAMAPAIP